MHAGLIMKVLVLSNLSHKFPRDNILEIPKFSLFLVNVTRNSVSSGKIGEIIQKMLIKTSESFRILEK